MAKTKDVTDVTIIEDVLPSTGVQVQENNLPIMQFLQKLIDSNQLPAHIKTANEAFTVVQMGKELGFPTMQAMHYLIPIQGKLSLSAKAIGAILRRHGVTYTTTEDAVYVYKDGTTSDYPVGGDSKPVDRRTTIVFSRDNQKEKVSFGWVDATSMGLTVKDNWKRMPKEMLFARCLSKGANRIASDLLLGLYNTDELFDAFDNGNIKAKRDDDGTIIEILN
jgi:hypothetical protein